MFKVLNKAAPRALAVVLEKDELPAEVLNVIRPVIADVGAEVDPPVVATVPLPVLFTSTQLAMSKATGTGHN